MDVGVGVDVEVGVGEAVAARSAVAAPRVTVGGAEEGSWLADLQQPQAASAKIVSPRISSICRRISDVLLPVRPVCQPQHRKPHGPIILALKVTGTYGQDWKPLLMCQNSHLLSRRKSFEVPVTLLLGA